MKTIHLNDDYGLRQGDDAAALVETHLESGVELLISPGTYAWESNPLDGTFNDARLASDTPGELVTLDHGDGFPFTTYIECASGTFELQDLEFTGTSVYSSPDNYLAFWASSPDATVRLKNVRRPDGCRQGEDGTGIYVRGPHEGLAQIIDCQAHGFTDNGLYASSPGDPSGGEANGGRVEVHRGFYKNNNISNVRLAGDFLAKDVVMVHDRHTETNEHTNTDGHSQRNLWLRDTDASAIGVTKPLSGEVKNCHVVQRVDFGGVSGAEGVPIMMQHRDGSSTSGTLTDCTVTTDETAYPAVHDAYDNSSWSVSGLHVTGSGDRSASRHPVACSGSSCQRARTTPYPVDGGAADDGGATDDLVAFVTRAGSGEATYEMTVGGPIKKVQAPYTSPSDNRIMAGGNDDVTKHADGSYTVTGATGNGYGDAYEITAPVTDVTVDTPDVMWIELNGTKVSSAELKARTGGDTGTGGGGGGDDSDPPDSPSDGSGGGAGGDDGDGTDSDEEHRDTVLATIAVALAYYLSQR